MKFLKQSTAVVIPMGPFLDKADGLTLKADATCITDIDHATTGIFLVKNGGTGAIRHQGVTASVADAYGMMLVTLDATDTNTLGRLRVCFAKAATYLPVWEDFQVLPATIFDSLVTGSGGAIPNIAAGSASGLSIVGSKMDIADAPSATGSYKLAEYIHCWDWTTLVLTAPVRCTLRALRAVRNKWTLSGGVWTTYAENESTANFAKAVTQDGNGNITGVGADQS
jgi:hypothetical protein